MTRFSKSFPNVLLILQCILFAATIWALFSDDLRLYGLQKSSDLSFAIITVFVLVIFVVAIICNILFVENYFYGKQSMNLLYESKLLKLPSFNFCLDIFATAAVALQVNAKL